MLSRRALLASSASLVAFAPSLRRALADPLAPPSPEHARLAALMDAFFAENLRQNPEGATQLGLDKGRLDPQYLPDLYTRNGSKDYTVLRWANHGLNNEEDLAFWLKLVEHAGIVPAGKYRPADFYTNAFNPHASDAAKSN